MGARAAALGRRSRRQSAAQSGGRDARAAGTRALAPADRMDRGLLPRPHSGGGADDARVDLGARGRAHDHRISRDGHAARPNDAATRTGAGADRSEEQTSELPSLMRNSSAVFGVTKQK